MFKRASLLLFSMLTREFVLFREIVLLYMATFREGWFAGRRESQSLSLKPEWATMSVKSPLLHRNSVEQWKMDGNLNILQTSALGFTSRIQPSACGLGLYARFVKPDNSSALFWNILLGIFWETKTWVLKLIYLLIHVLCFNDEDRYLISYHTHDSISLIWNVEVGGRPCTNAILNESV